MEIEEVVVDRIPIHRGMIKKDKLIDQWNNALDIIEQLKRIYPLDIFYGEFPISIGMTITISKADYARYRKGRPVGRLRAEEIDDLLAYLELDEWDVKWQHKVATIDLVAYVNVNFLAVVESQMFYLKQTMENKEYENLLRINNLIRSPKDLAANPNLSHRFVSNLLLKKKFNKVTMQIESIGVI